MEVETGRGQGGQEGAKAFPYHGSPGLLAGANPVVGGGPESSHPGESLEAPAPARGIMFVECGVCKKPLPSEPVDLSDDVNGGISTGLCPPHLAEAMAELDRLYPPQPEPKPPVDADRDWGYTRAFLTGLGLWNLPGGVAVVLFIPYALLACGGAR